MDIFDKLKNLSERELLLFIIGEIKSIKRDGIERGKILMNHLTHHEKQDNRRWRIYLILFGVFCTTIAGVIVTLLVP